MPSSFKMDNKDIQSQEATEVFNDYFFNIAHNLQLQIDNLISPLSLLKDAYQTGFLSMEIIPVTKGEIISIICSVKSENSPGYDGIPSRILKLCTSVISEPFSYICNMSIWTGVFPDRLKCAAINLCTKKAIKLT
jgi:hypothetical protein